MSSVNQLAQGLADRCATISGLRCYPVMHPKPEPPAVCVQPVRWTYDETMDGTWRVVFEVWAFVNAATLYTSQQSLFEYLAPSGSKSIPAAIYEDPTLGGLTAETRVLGGPRPPTETETAGGRLLGAAFEVEILAM